MSTVIANNITSTSDDGHAVEIHISQDSELVSEGGLATVGNSVVKLGTVKGYCTCFFMSTNVFHPGIDTATLNITGFTDVGTGNLRYAHTNNYVAVDDYIGLPNDGNYGKTYADINATSSAEQFSHTENNSVSDSVLACGFAGELA